MQQCSKHLLCRVPFSSVFRFPFQALLSPQLGFTAANIGQENRWAAEADSPSLYAKARLPRVWSRKNYIMGLGVEYSPWGGQLVALIMQWQRIQSNDCLLFRKEGRRAHTTQVQQVGPWVHLFGGQAHGGVWKLEGSTPGRWLHSSLVCAGSVDLWWLRAPGCQSEVHL